MSRLIFNAKDALRVAQHSLNAPTQRPIAYTKTPVKRPAVILVHDQGVYLMSNGEPRDIVKGVSSFCAYAKDCDPNTGEEWWENSRDLVGGDDFAETLEGWAEDIVYAVEQGATKVYVRVSEQSLGLTFGFPRRMTPALLGEQDAKGKPDTSAQPTGGHR